MATYNLLMIKVNLFYIDGNFFLIYSDLWGSQVTHGNDFPYPGNMDT
jgi:hypothetical protein